MKKPVRHMFPGFLDDETAYSASVSFWERLVRRAERESGQESEWTRWIPTPFADRVTPIDTPGNPILDGFSRRLDRAFRIVQLPPTTTEVEFEAWIKSYREDRSDRSALPAEELVMVLSLSEESATLVKSLLVAWMDPDVTVDDIEARIAMLERDQTHSGE